MFNIEVDGDHCYRVGKQGVLVHNASGAKAFCPHFEREEEKDRQNANKTNVEHYLDTHKSGHRILQIATGSNVLQNALALDIAAFDGYTAVIVTTSEKYSVWFKEGSFDEVYAINPLNTQTVGGKVDKNYNWLFENALYALKIGGKLTVVGTEKYHRIFNYITNPKNLAFVRGLGFELEDGIPANLKELLRLVSDPKILNLPVETSDPTYAQLLIREGKLQGVVPGDTFTVENPAQRFQVIFIKKS